MVIAMEMTIQQVAAVTQLSVHTLRYYERIGLMTSINRAANGHRRYSSHDIAWIEFLTRLRTTGMSIQQMQEFADLRKQGNITISQRRHLLEAHQQLVNRQLEELSQNLSVIKEKIQHYQELEAKYDANSSGTN
jgi:DNA-binding transcriptional MerR regulator